MVWLTQFDRETELQRAASISCGAESQCYHSLVNVYLGVFVCGSQTIVIHDDATIFESQLKSPHCPISKCRWPVLPLFTHDALSSGPFPIFGLPCFHITHDPHQVLLGSKPRVHLFGPQLISNGNSCPNKQLYVRNCCSVCGFVVSVS